MRKIDDIEEVITDHEDECLNSISIDVYFKGETKILRKRS